jgi:hypothetical protein
MFFPAKFIEFSMYSRCILNTSPNLSRSELARAIRYIGVPALADDILNLSARKISWVTLTAVAKPYTGNSRQGPAKPARPENVGVQNSLNSFGHNAGPSSFSKHDLSDTKAKRLSVAFVALDSDEEEEQLRAKHGSRSPTSHETSSIPASVAPSSSSSNWSSQARQTKDVKITKSMEQESWHDNDRSQDLSGRNQRNLGQSLDSAESPLRGSRVMKGSPHRLSDGNNERLSSPDRYHSPSEGTRSRSHSGQRSPAEAQRRWDSKDDDGDSDRDGYDSRSDEGKGEEEDGFEEAKMISPIRPDTDSHGNRLDRKVPYDPLDISPKRVMTSSPVLDGPGPGLRSPPLPPKPTRLSRSPNTVKQSRPVESNYLNASNDSSFFSGPHPLASSWETAISQSYEGGLIGDSPKTTGLPPKKPPRPHTMAQSLEPRGRPNLVSPGGGGKAMSFSHNGNGKNNQVKRSISWSAAVSSSHMKPPRPKSTGNIMSSSFASLSMDSEGGLSADHDYDAYVSLPPLSEYAERTGVIIEGWLEKKSARTGFWQKVSVKCAALMSNPCLICERHRREILTSLISVFQRFFVLSESSEEFCVMRIYYKTVESSWGLVPLRKKATIPIGSVKGVSSVSSKIKQGELKSRRQELHIDFSSIGGLTNLNILLNSGKQFSLTYTSTEKEKGPIPIPRSRKGSDATHASKGAHDQGDMSEWGDSDGEGEGDGMIKSMILKADDLKVRNLL